MAGMLPSILVSLLLCATAQSHSVTQEWTADLGKLGNGPQASIFDDIVVFVSNDYKDARDQILLQTYTIQGDPKNSCKIDRKVGSPPFIINEVKVTHFGKSNVVISWLHKLTQMYGVMPFNLHDLELLVVNLEDCSSYDLKIELEHSYNSVYEPEYLVLPNGEDKFDLFARGRLLCPIGVCKVTLPGPDGHIEKVPQAITFVNNDSKFWKLIPVNPNDVSQGFYYISQNGTVELTKLNADGTVIKSSDLKVRVNQFNQDKTSVSNAYGFFSFCAVTKRITSIECHIFDSSLNDRLYFIKGYENQQSFFTTMNTKDGSVLIQSSIWTDEKVNPARNEIIQAIKIQPDGSVALKFDVFTTMIHWRNFVQYQTFVDDRKDVYCDFLPVVKANENGGQSREILAKIKCFKLE